MAGKRTVRGQAALEYLMTYGWALLVIAIVISVLVLINPFSPPQGCRFDTVGFTCDPPAFKNDAGHTTLYLNILNGNNNNIIIKKLYCTSDKSSAAPTLNAPYLAINVPRQSNYTIRGETCYISPGNAMGTTRAGTDFSGKLWLLYKNEEDPSGYPDREVSATIAGKVSQ